MGARRRRRLGAGLHQSPKSECRNPSSRKRLQSPEMNWRRSRASAVMVDLLVLALVSRPMDGNALCVRMFPMINAVDTFQAIELLCRSKQTEDLARHIIHVADRLLKSPSDLNHLDITHELECLFPSVAGEVLNEFVVARAICLSKSGYLRHPFLRDASVITASPIPIHANTPIVFSQCK